MTGRRSVLRLLAGVGVLPLLPRGWGGPAARSVGLAAAGAAAGWASGGTAAMTGKAAYPDPFAAAPDVCALAPSTTQGPCTTADDLFREDVSEGWPGLPVRLALRVVDTACAPLAGATVKIWHTNIEGSYSGQTPFNGLCLLRPAYASANFFRGAGVTGADGVVSFDTCFPGWYRGRAIHIHFQVARGGVTSRVSQLFFPEDVTADVFANQAEYAAYGQPDTDLARDGVVAAMPAAQRDRHLLAVARMRDGAMLASKTVAVVAGVPPTPTPPPAPCAGDCDASGAVSVDELVTGVDIALGGTPVDVCAPFDADGSGTVTVDELLAAVDAALSGCP